MKTCEDIWRYKLYKEYKNNRNYIKKNIYSIKITELEADNIIAIIAIYLENINIYISFRRF